MLINNIIQDIKDFQEKYPKGIVILRWATATGKSAMSVELARTLPCEIISSDSRQFFRWMDIGTDKVSKAIRDEIPHHQIDMIDPDQFYTAWQWKKDVSKLIPEIQSRWKLPLIVGGTWLYVDTLYKNYSVPEVSPDFDLRATWDMMEIQEPWVLWKKLYAIDPIEAKKHHPNSTRYIIRALEIYEKTWLTKTDAAKEQPVERPILLLGLWREKDASNARIAKRVKEMLTWWLTDEVLWILAKWYKADLQSMQGIWYKETVEFLACKIDQKQLEELITIHTQQYAKRQRTWFKRYIADAEKNPKENVVYKVYYL